MGIASLVIGIVSVVISLFPLVGLIVLIPAVIGLILGIVDNVQKKKKQQERGKQSLSA